MIIKFKNLKIIRPYKSQIKFLIHLPLALFALLIVKILSPIIFIRFGKIRSDRIGHFIPDACLIYYEKKESDFPSLDLYCLSNKPVNSYWKKYISKFLNISLFGYFFFSIKITFPYSKHLIRENAGEKYFSLDKKHFLQKYPSMLKFSNYENGYAWKQLNKIGIKKNQKFVCYQIRNSNYLKKEMPNLDFSYHSFRNADVKNYFSSMKWICNKGYIVFKMGYSTDNDIKNNLKKLSPYENKIIDYSSFPYKSDFLDIWLLSNCEFCITTGSGIDEAAVWSKKPIFYSDCTSPIGMWPSSDVFCSMKYFYKDNKKVNFSTYLDCDSFTSSDFVNMGIRIENMKSHDILESTKEFYEVFINNGSYLNQKKNNQLLSELRKHKSYQNRSWRKGKKDPRGKNKFYKDNFSKILFSKNYIRWLNTIT